MGDAPRREFSFVEGAAICLAMIGIQLSSEVINQWGTYFYSPSVGVGRTVYVVVGLVGYIFIAGTVWDAMTGPIVGLWSDKTRTKPGWLRIVPIYGRRRPFIFWGSILMTFTAIAFWFPPVEGTSTANFVYGAAMLCLHWTMFGMALVPLNSLPMEIARSEAERVRLGTFIAIGMIVGLAMAVVLPGELITRLDPARIEESLAVTLPPDATSEAADAVAAALVPRDAPAAPGDIGRAAEATGRPTIAFKGTLIGALRQAHGMHGMRLALPDDLRERCTIEETRFATAAVFTGDAARGRDAALVLGDMRRRLPALLHGAPLPEDAPPDLNTFIDENLELAPRAGGFAIIFYRDLLGALAFAGMADLAAAQFPEAQRDAVALLHIEGSFSAQGYRILAVVLALLSLLFLQLPVWLVRERYDSEAAPREDAAFLAGLKDVVRNRPFVVYFVAFFLFTMGFLAAQRVLPYWAELGLGGDEGTVTRLMLPFIVTALLSYAVIPALAARLHIKWMMFLAFLIIATGLPGMYLIARLDIGLGTKVALGAALFGYCGIGQGIMYVMTIPMMGEIIDYDERRSGRRREALYNGLSGVAWKSAMAGSIFLATQSMNLWGNSVRRFDGVLLVGPIAGLLALLGLVAILFYPRLNKRDDAGPK